MSDYIGIEGADEVLDTGLKLSALGEDAAEEAKALKAKIADVAATRPWGDDMFGEEFLKQYNQVLEGGHDPFVDVINSELEQTGERVRKIGTTTVSAMLTYEAQDLLGGREIAREGEA